mmetsp:Transcript_19418/g.49638  ORF Transcript_19418/g.49638 Transcript_19418/m.49638 type:complete len:167 (-) Transcript_19418:337-837(-)|eukprot:CAMPEP_0115858118 /NCGR_PEP_ID=MMETSP0287-20121206/15932_1 /TAXON_ID=412157 /ORGANISM="Chrysochromulina rotalis, Strain UIO044" /LENGTH=166 /DNA_ID=CAMNT_0003312371 /DNA_START=27 /DNA_END=527 /DNA_ORIENTATION=+
MLSLVAVGTAVAFSPQAPALSVGHRAAVSPTMRLDAHLDRRSAVLGIAGLAAASPLTAHAEIFQGGTSIGLDDGKDYNAGTEDALAKIAAANKAKLQEEKAKKAAEFAKGAGAEEENKAAPYIVGGVGAASLVFTLPFFYKNLARLGLKFASVVNKDIKEDDFKRG